MHEARATAALSFPRAKLRGELLHWWSTARHERDVLPWRKRRDPWEVLVAEVMLAQTQAPRVATSYVQFIERFPTAAACAQATEGELLRAWSGLGYNRRALHLHTSARMILERHHGRVPEDLSSLLELKGVGPYIARAVIAFSFGGRVAVLDTNVGRVLARAVVGRSLPWREAQSIADALVPESQPREWNLALIDFGNLICSARSPRCDVCPLHAAHSCAWRRSGSSEDPAEGSAAVSRRQAPFSDSDRQVRGRIVKAACIGAIPPSELAHRAGLADAPERAWRVVRGLVDDGLLVEDHDGTLALP